MGQKTRPEQLRQLHADARVAAFLARNLTPGLVRSLVDSVELEKRVRRRRMSQRQRRLRRSLRIGAYAVGVAAAAAAVRTAMQHVHADDHSAIDGA
jgi:hypothetical protein